MIVDGKIGVIKKIKKKTVREKITVFFDLDKK